MRGDPVEAGGKAAKVPCSGRFALSEPPATLDQLARQYFGAALDNPELADTEYADLLGREFGTTTPGNGMRWYAT
ncbi:hypothetical protein ACFWX8_44465, partial [Streptomyces violascens]